MNSLFMSLEISKIDSNIIQFIRLIALSDKMNDLFTEKPILVTGGTGFIAGHIISQLLERG